MKTLLSFLTILLFTIYFGCSSNLVSPSYSNANNSGQVALKISSDSIPSNVVKVTAILSQSGKDSLISSVEPLSSSSASLNFSNVSVGTWHLKVEAFDQDNLIVYSGETDLQVNAGIITQVNLTLIPTGQGKGSIYIFVNWGQSNSIWTDYQYNPIFSVKDIPYFTLSVDQGQVMYDNGIYKMWFMNLYYNGMGDVSYAESNDGISWHIASNGPVLTAGQPGNWDDNSVGMGYIIKENGVYKYYYSGNREPHTGMRQIGLAVSQDGINWEKYPDPVLQSDSSQWFLGVHAVIKINNVYYMYYESSSEFDYTFNINLATSKDGIHWIKYDRNPIIVPSQSWEQGSIGYATITDYNNGYMMTYSNRSQTAIGVAYSNDGITWTKDNQNPKFSTQDAAGSWCTKTCYPYSLKVGNEYRIYYSGYGSDNQFHIGMAYMK